MTAILRSDGKGDGELPERVGTSWEDYIAKFGETDFCPQDLIVVKRKSWALCERRYGVLRGIEYAFEKYFRYDEASDTTLYGFLLGEDS